MELMLSTTNIFSNRIYKYNKKNSKIYSNHIFFNRLEINILKLVKCILIIIRLFSIY